MGITRGPSNSAGRHLLREARVQRFIQLKTPCALAIASLACACGSDESNGNNPGGTGGAAASGGSGGVGNAGWSGNSGGSGAAGSGAGGSGGGQQVFEPPFGKLEPGWNVLKPGRGTICARGTPFQYFVRPGTVNRW